MHFLHTPASVARYAALLTGRSWSFSAHAKDIWTTPDWELAEKLRDAAWGVTCTRDGLARLESLAPGRTLLAYHGLDLGRFPAPPPRREPRDGSDPGGPAPAALRRPPRRQEGARRPDRRPRRPARRPALAPRPDRRRRAARAPGGAASARSGLAGPDRVPRGAGAARRWSRRCARPTCSFCRPSRLRAATGTGLPNVLMEAASQALPILATAFAGTPEFITDGVHGMLVPRGGAGARWPRP